MARRRLSVDPDLAAMEKCNLITDASSIAPAQKEKVISLVENMQMLIAARPQGEPFRFKLDDFEFGGRLGSGLFSTVFLVREKKSEFVIALKAVDKAILKKSEMEADFEREILLHSKLSHPNIVRFLTLFEDPVNWYLLMEYVPGGNLSAFQQSQKDGRIRPAIAIKLTYQLADAVCYLHSLKIVHRDIKPDNILLDVYGSVKLSNFGRAACCPCTLSLQCNVSSYVAPEILEKKNYDYKADIWSIGVIIYEMVCGDIPFSSKDVKFMLKKIQKETVIFPDFIDESAEELISRLLKYKPKDRLDASDILNHPWLNS